MDQSAETVGYRLELAEAYEPWLECVEELKLAGLDQAAAERAVSKAYGWTYSAYWRGEKVRMVVSHRSNRQCGQPSSTCIPMLIVLSFTKTEQPGLLNLSCDAHQESFVKMPLRL